MTTKPQSDADVAFEDFGKSIGGFDLNNDRWHDMGADEIFNAGYKAAIARTKPLVEALGDMEGGLELMRMAIMGHADRTELTKRINLLIKDCQRWQALAQEKGRNDG